MSSLILVWKNIDLIIYIFLKEKEFISPPHAKNIISSDWVTVADQEDSSFSFIHKYFRCFLTGHGTKVPAYKNSSRCPAEFHKILLISKLQSIFLDVKYWKYSPTSICHIKCFHFWFYYEALTNKLCQETHWKLIFFQYSFAHITPINTPHLYRYSVKKIKLYLLICIFWSVTKPRQSHIKIKIY